jgi:hypothetical protein
MSGLGIFEYTIWMKGKDGQRFPTLVPKSALPNMASTSGGMMSGPCVNGHGGKRMIQNWWASSAFFIDTPPTSETTILRYAQCVTMPKDTLPAYDFEFPYLVCGYKIVRQDTFPEEAQHTTPEDCPDGSRKVFLGQEKIEWNIGKLMELYVLSSSFGNGRICDMVMDEMIGQYRAEEPERRDSAHSSEATKHPNTQVSDESTRVNDLELNAEDVHFVFMHTASSHPIRRFLSDVLVSQGTNLFLCEEDKKILADDQISFSKSEMAKCRLFSEDERCTRYHLHTTFSEECYRKVSTTVKDWNPQPTLEAEQRIEEMVDDENERLHDKLESLQECRTLTEADYNAYAKKIKAKEKKIRTRMASTLKVPKQQSRAVGQKFPKLIPEGFVASGLRSEAGESTGSKFVGKKVMKIRFDDGDDS